MGHAVWPKDVRCDCYLTDGGKYDTEEVAGFVSDWSGMAQIRMPISELPRLCVIPEVML